MTPQGFLTGGLALLALVMDKVGLASVTSLIRSGAGSGLAALALVSDPGNFGVVLANLLVVVKGLGDWAAKQAEEFADSSPFDRFPDSSQLAEAFGMCDGEADALVAFASGHMTALQQKRMVNGLRQLVRVQAWEALQAVKATSNELALSGLGDLMREAGERLLPMATALAGYLSGVVAVKDELPEEGRESMDVPLVVRLQAYKALTDLERTLGMCVQHVCGPAVQVGLQASSLRERVDTLQKSTEGAKGLVNADVGLSISVAAKRADMLVEREVERANKSVTLQDSDTAVTAEHKTGLRIVADHLESTLAKVREHLRKFGRALKLRAAQPLRLQVREGSEANVHQELCELMKEEWEAWSASEEKLVAFRSSIDDAFLQGEAHVKAVVARLNKLMESLSVLASFSDRVEEVTSAVSFDTMSDEYLTTLLDAAGLAEDEAFVETFLKARKAANVVVGTADDAAEQLVSLLEDLGKGAEQMEKGREQCQALEVDVRDFRERAALMPSWLAEDCAASCTTSTRWWSRQRQRRSASPQCTWCWMSPRRSGLRPCVRRTSSRARTACRRAPWS
mmetsp:Transcript_71477/g.231195  ORF Transcript_71477/g.231195 Transcript_71477/m.231195 type:complete len:568 (-) Transcript_71477:429-2132(-)